MVAGSPLISACSSIPFVGDNEEYKAWKATDGASGRINLQDVEEAFKATSNFGVARDFEIRVSPNPPKGGVETRQVGMREPTRGKAWAPLGPM